MGKVAVPATAEAGGLGFRVRWRGTEMEKNKLSLVSLCIGASSSLVFN
jgi:hypothetical protein